MKKIFIILLAALLVGCSNDISHSSYNPTYTITWENYDGSILEVDSNVPYGTTPTYDGSSPSKPNDAEYTYTWNGWSPSVTEVNGDTTYTAQYTSSKNTYTITWKNYDGSILEIDSNVLYGTTPTYDGATPIKQNDSQYSYTWSGWTPFVQPVTSNTTYVATFSDKLVNAKISFDLNGGTTTHSTEPFYSSTIESKDFFFDVKKENYNFRGWSYNGQMVFDQNGNKLSNPSIKTSMVFKAEFSQKVILTIYSNIPNAGTLLGEGTYEYNTNVDVSAHPNQGYSFIGWYYNNTLLSNKEIYRYMMWSEDVSLEARFKINSYVLHVGSAHPLLGQVMIMDNNYYEDESERNITYLDSVSISAYTKTEEHRFLGWYDANGNLVTPNAVYTFVMTNYDYSLYARWESPSYSLTVTSNYPEANENIIGTGLHEYGSQVSLTALSEKGFKFIGWYQENTCLSKEATYNLLMPAKDYNLNAKFEPITYTINYELDNGINNSNNPLTYNCTQEILLYEPTKEHYTFNGWLLNDQKITSIAKGTYGNITLVATWIPYSYNVNVVTNDDSFGIVTGSGSYQHGSTVILKATTYSGAFEGWYKDGKLISTEQTYIFRMPTNDITLEARWNSGLVIENQTVVSCNKNAKSVIIPEGVTSIENQAFYGCSYLTSITIPDGVTSIGDHAFYCCYSLTSITIPNSVTSVGTYAFGNCSRLQYNKYENCLYLGNKENPYLVLVEAKDTSITEATIHTNTKVIGGHAFYGCSSLISITIPNNVTSIESYAFYECSSLTSIIIPNNVTSIGSYTFYGCSSLTIYCETSSQPSGWGSWWNDSNRPVYWAGEWSYVNGVPTPR